MEAPKRFKPYSVTRRTLNLMPARFSSCGSSLLRYTDMTSILRVRNCALRAEASIWIRWILLMSTWLMRVKGPSMSPNVSPTDIASRLPSRSFGVLSGTSGKEMTPMGARV